MVLQGPQAKHRQMYPPGYGAYTPIDGQPMGHGGPPSNMPPYSGSSYQTPHQPPHHPQHSGGPMGPPGGHYGPGPSSMLGSGDTRHQGPGGYTPGGSGPGDSSVGGVKSEGGSQQQQPFNVVAAAGAEVRAVFSSEPELLSWVTQMPSQEVVQRFTRWAERLKTCTISNEPPADALMSGNMNSWMHTSEAVKVLQILEQHPVSLRLLELSNISKPVAMLRVHGEQSVAALAGRVTLKWRAIAQAALDRATQALTGYAPQAQNAPVS